MASPKSAERPVFGPPRPPYMNAIGPGVSTPSDQAANDSPSPLVAVALASSGGKCVRANYEPSILPSRDRSNLVGSSHANTDAETELDLLKSQDILDINAAAAADATVSELEIEHSDVHAVFGTSELLGEIMLLLDEKTPSILCRVSKTF
ncbi:hypothetical protein LTR95_013501 [Oleoguttula sp. CCFEE 5521]